MRILRLLALTCVLFGAVACGDDEPTTPTQPTTPRPTTTDRFSGRLTVNGAATHSFATGSSGLITLNLVELTPDNAAIIGVSLGTWSGTACQIVLANDNATQAASVTGNAGSAGNFCARVYDVGRLNAATEYTLEVVHY